MTVREGSVVLVVGVRSPAALELVRQLAFHGLVVEGADFLRFPLGRFSSRLTVYHRLPSPRWRPADFRLGWNRLLQRAYAAVFACNEEIFWLSRQPQQPPLAVWNEPAGLETLHRKDDFVQLLQRLGLPAPRTCLPGQVAELGGRPFILKRIYSRFGGATRLEPDPHKLPSEPGWLAQERMVGEEVCFSGFGWRGQLVTGCCYRSRWGDLGQHRGAGLHFERLCRPDLEAQAAEVIRALGYSGPIGVDFVGGTAVECNPRWTSGIHLLDLTPVLRVLGLATRSGWRVPARVQLAAAMLLRCRAGLDFWRDWWGTSDAIWSAADPWPALAQPLVLMETAWRAGRRRINLSQALTWDIEWNGLADVAPM